MLHSMSRSWGSGSGQTTSSTSSWVTLNRRISLRYAHHLASLTKKQRVAQLSTLPETGFLVRGHNPVRAFMRIYPDCSSAIRLDEPFELLASLISQVVITTVTSGTVVQCQSVC